MACTTSRPTPTTTGVFIVLEKADATKIHEGSLVAVDAAGKAIPAAKAENQPAIGMAFQIKGNAVTVERGTHLWDNDAANAVTPAHIGKECYIVDDCTVCSLSTGSSAAGKVLGFEGDQVIVETK